MSGYLSYKGKLRKEISNYQVIIIIHVEQISSHCVSSPSGTSVWISSCLASLGWSSWQTLYDWVNSSMSFIRFLQNSDVRALNLVFLVPWWLARSFDEMFRLPGVFGLLEADHLWPITLPKGPVGLNQWWKPLYCGGTTIKNIFTLLSIPLCTFIIQQCISFFSLP